MIGASAEHGPFPPEHWGQKKKITLIAQDDPNKLQKYV
jgi:hypothetical protein